MLKNYLQKKQQKLLEHQTDFYTSSGIHVYFKDALNNDEIDTEEVVNKFESAIPHHLLSEVEMIIVGTFDEFHNEYINKL